MIESTAHSEVSATINHAAAPGAPLHHFHRLQARVDRRRYNEPGTSALCPGAADARGQAPAFLPAPRSSTAVQLDLTHCRTYFTDTDRRRSSAKYPYPDPEANCAANALGNTPASCPARCRAILGAVRVLKRSSTRLRPRPAAVARRAVWTLHHDSHTRPSLPRHPRRLHQAALQDARCSAGRCSAPEPCQHPR